jgi:hypothetical protein
MRIYATSSSVAVSLTLLTGCCVSYHSVAKPDRQIVDRSVEATTLVTVIESALKSESQAGATITSDYGAYIVRRGRETVSVRIDEQERTISLGWDWRTHTLPGRLQSEIARAFDTTYHSQLRFEELPCGVFGP